MVFNGKDSFACCNERLRLTFSLSSAFIWGTSRKLAAAEPPLQIHRSSRMISHTCISPLRFLYPFGSLHLKSQKLYLSGIVHHRAGPIYRMNFTGLPKLQIFQREFALESKVIRENEKSSKEKGPVPLVSAITSGHILHLFYAEAAAASEEIKANAIYEVGELFELGIQLSYLLLLLGLLGVGTFFVIRQVLVRRELDLSAKELQEQVRSGDASATEYFELGAVMLRRKFYPAAIKYLLQAIEKWDGDDQDLAQVYNALGVCYVRDEKLDKGISQFETAVKLQPGYVTAWNNLGDAYERKKELNSALKAFEEVLLFDPNNKIARPRRDALKDRVDMYKGVSVKPKKR